MSVGTRTHHGVAFQLVGIRIVAGIFHDDTNATHAIGQYIDQKGIEGKNASQDGTNLGLGGIAMGKDGDKKVAMSLCGGFIGASCIVQSRMILIVRFFSNGKVPC